MFNELPTEVVFDILTFLDRHTLNIVVGSTSRRLHAIANRYFASWPLLMLESVGVDKEDCRIRYTVADVEGTRHSYHIQFDAQFDVSTLLTLPNYVRLGHLDIIVDDNNKFATYKFIEQLLCAYGDKIDSVHVRDQKGWGTVLQADQQHYCEAVEFLRHHTVSEEKLIV